MAEVYVEKSSQRIISQFRKKKEFNINEIIVHRSIDYIKSVQPNAQPLDKPIDFVKAQRNIKLEQSIIDQSHIENVDQIYKDLQKSLNVNITPRKFARMTSDEQIQFEIHTKKGFGELENMQITEVIKNKQNYFTNKEKELKRKREIKLMKQFMKPSHIKNQIIPLAVEKDIIQNLKELQFNKCIHPKSYPFKQQVSLSFKQATLSKSGYGQQIIEKQKINQQSINHGYHQRYQTSCQRATEASIDSSIITPSKSRIQNKKQNFFEKEETSPKNQKCDLVQNLKRHFQKIEKSSFKKRDEKFETIRQSYEINRSLNKDNHIKKLKQKVSQNENSLCQQMNDFYTTKIKKYDQLSTLVQSLARERPATVQIRQRAYKTDGDKFDLQRARLKTERQRRPIISNQNWIDWYEDLQKHQQQQKTSYFEMETQIIILNRIKSYLQEGRALNQHFVIQIVEEIQNKEELKVGESIYNLILKILQKLKMDQKMISNYQKFHDYLQIN